MKVKFKHKNSDKVYTGYEDCGQFRVEWQNKDTSETDSTFFSTDQAEAYFTDGTWLDLSKESTAPTIFQRIRELNCQLYIYNQGEMELDEGCRRMVEQTYYCTEDTLEEMVSALEASRASLLKFKTK